MQVRVEDIMDDLFRLNLPSFVHQNAKGLGLSSNFTCWLYQRPLN